ncbi:MAG: 30S ribosomal protein S17 [Candidatus Berkelbacteria bacterium]
MKKNETQNLEKVKATKTVKRLVGLVVSDKMDKTVLVQITEKFTHPMYGKVYSKNRKLQAHDEKNEFKVGDKVEITESRPYSKNKSWQVTKLVSLQKNLDGSAK